MLLGAASIAQSVLSLGHKGDFFSINWGCVTMTMTGAPCDCLLCAGGGWG